MRYDSIEYENTFYLYETIRTTKGISGHGPYTKKQEREIRRIIDMYKGGMSEEQRLQCCKENHIENIMDYLKECHNKFEEQLENRRKAKKEVLEKLGALEVCQYLEGKNDVYMNGAQERGSKEICIRCVRSYSYEMTLILENVTTEHEFNYHWDDDDYWEISEDENGFVFEYFYNRYSDGEKQLHVAHFTAARVEKSIYSALNVPVYWDFEKYILYMADELYERIHEYNMPANKLEIELLPLIRFLNEYDAGLEPEIPEGLEDRFPEIRRICTGKNKKNQSRADSEPFWRKIYEALAESQKSYKSKVESGSAALIEELGQMREDIDNVIKQSGYEGQYPNYHRFDEGKFRTYYIKCMENSICDITISFVCGGIIHKGKSKIEKANGTDAFSCTFSEKGRRYYEILSRTYDYESDEEFNEEVNEAKPLISKYAAVAVKKAEKQKLTKSEKKIPDFYQSKLGILSIIGVLMLVAVCFGGIVTMGLTAISIVITFLFTWSIDTVGEMLCSMPWIEMGLATGGLLALVMILSVLWVVIRKN